MSDEVKEMVLELGDRNPGAIRVLCDVAVEHPGTFPAVAQSLREMAIKGGLVWVAFKDHCREDYADFIVKTIAKDAGMLATVALER